MNRIKRTLSIVIIMAIVLALCLPVYANENILNLDFRNGYNFDYFYADAATGQNQSNCPWFKNINDTIVYDTGTYSNGAYPTKSNGRPAYPRANINQAVTAEENEENQVLYEFDVKYERGFLPSTYMLRYGAEGWVSGKTADVVIAEITAGGVLKFGDYEKSLSLNTTYKVSVLVDIRDTTRVRSLYVDGVLVKEGVATAIGAEPDTNEDAKKVFTSSIVLKPYTKNSGSYYYLDGMVEFDNVKITLIDDIESFSVLSEDGKKEYNIPLSGTELHNFTANGLFSNNLNATWSVVPNNDEVTINADGVLTITSDAEAGEYEIFAERSGKTASIKINLKKITIEIDGADRIYLPQNDSYVELKYELMDSNGNSIPAVFSLNKAVDGIYIDADGNLRIFAPDISKIGELIVTADANGVTYNKKLDLVAGYYTDFTDEDWGSEAFIAEDGDNKYLNPNGERANSPDIMTAPGFENAVVRFKYNAQSSADKKVIFSGASNMKDDSTVDSNVWWFNFYAKKSGGNALVSASAGANILASEQSVAADTDWLDVILILNGNKKKATMYVNDTKVFENKDLSAVYFDYKIKQIISYAAIDDVSVSSGEVINEENIDIVTNTNLNIPKPNTGRNIQIALDAKLVYGGKEIPNVNFDWALGGEYQGLTIAGNKLIVTDAAPESFNLTTKVKGGERLSFVLGGTTFTPNIFVYAYENKLFIEGNPNSNVQITIFKPEDTTSIAKAFAQSSDKGSDNYIVANVVLDAAGKAEYDISSFAAGAYKAYVKEIGLEQENYMEFNHKEEQLFSDSSNLEDVAFKTVLEKNTSADKASIDKAYNEYLNLTDKDLICGLCKENIENFYIACEIASYLQDDVLSISKANSLKDSLKALGLSDEILSLIVKNIDHKAVRDAAYATNPSTPEKLLEVLKEKSILIGLSKLANVYDGKVFLAAVGNSKYDNSSQKDYICEQVGNVKYNTLPELNAAIDGVKYPEPDTGGGGSPSNNVGSYTGPIVPVLSNQENVQKQKFSDVDDMHWGYKSITALADMGIVEGSDGKFRPNDSITRAEFVKMLCVRFNIEEFYECAFADVTANDWFLGSVAGAEKRGLICGDGTNFLPRANITRQDAAVMVYRFIKDSGYILPSGTLEFADSNNISEYAKEAIAALKADGKVAGTGDNMFMPINNITRAEAAQMIYNTLERGNK